MYKGPRAEGEWADMMIKLIMSGVQILNAGVTSPAAHLHSKCHQVAWVMV